MILESLRILILGQIANPECTLTLDHKKRTNWKSMFKTDILLCSYLQGLVKHKVWSIGLLS